VRLDVVDDLFARLGAPPDPVTWRAFFSPFVCGSLKA
jgi:hypothetical protein